MIDEKKLNRDDLCDICRCADCANCFSDEDFEKWIDNQPKVGEWIPVSERLPDNAEHDWVLAQMQGDDGFMCIPYVMEYRESKDDWYLDDDEHPCWLKERHGDRFKVIAWMPLPEPYKEQNNG